MPWDSSTFKERLAGEQRYRGRFKLDSVEDKPQGTYGAVYSVVDNERGERVAIKIAHTTGKLEATRFGREREIMYKLRGRKHVIELFEHGEVDHYPILVMEYADRSLAHGNWNEEKLTVLAEEMCSALDEIHDASVYHRDLKPGNILFVRDVLKLCDFSDAQIEGTKTSGSLKGTLFYLAPEVIRSHSKANSPEAELYSLGCVLYEMASGKLLFDEGMEDASSGSGYQEMIGSLVKLKEDPGYIASKVDALETSQEVREAVRACLQPKKRISTTQELLNTLRKSPTTGLDQYIKEIESCLGEPLEEVLGVTQPEYLEPALNTWRALRKKAGKESAKKAEGLLAERKGSDVKILRKYAPNHSQVGETAVKKDFEVLLTHLESKQPINKREWHYYTGVLIDVSRLWRV